jgi:hypothetical protein
MNNPMASDTVSEPLPDEIRTLLSGLRWRIRAYVWLEGVSLAVAWLGLTFWCGLALDYLPVLVGIGEMPRLARGVLLIGISLVLAWILYRWVLRRGFVRLADRSMAMLLERRNQDLAESLITAVELSGPGRGDGSPQTLSMLAETRRQALARVGDIQLRNVFNLRPLAISVTGALLLIATVGAFYVVNAKAWELGFGRLYLLKNDTWPRNARIEVVGMDLRGDEVVESERPILPFRDSALKVAKGSSLALVVRADASRRVVPGVCVVHYRTAEGDHGRVNMTRIGRIRDGYQLYRYEGKPFDGILSDVEFDAVGFDHRVSGYRLQAVDSPTVVEVQVACQFPRYMVDEKRSLWLPRTIDLTAGTQLPRGTKLAFHARANKPLKRAVLSNPDSNELTELDISRESGDMMAFSHAVEQLDDHLTLDVMLTDVDDVGSERPFRIHVSGIEDTPPVIDMRLRGIGTAVTPNVLVPTVGKITDDYGLGKSWIEAIVNGGEPKEFELRPSSTGEAERSIDFQSERGRPDGISLAPGAKLVLTVRSVDQCELGGGPNQAAGDQYQLEVVTPEQLLTRLEARELELRRRFEQVIGELEETRDMLVRIRVEGPEQKPPAADPADKIAAEDGDEEDQGTAGSDPSTQAAERLQRVWSLRLLRAQQSLLQSQKSTQEVLGIAASFGDIHEELINNRVDTEDRKTRLKEQIATPLQSIADTQFAEFARALEKLAAVISAVERSGQLAAEDKATVDAAQIAVDQVHGILRELSAVLDRMLDLESFNELLDIVRGLIEDQERLADETKKEQKKAILDLLK